MSGKAEPTTGHYAGSHGNIADRVGRARKAAEAMVQADYSEQARRVREAVEAIDPNTLGATPGGAQSETHQRSFQATTDTPAILRDLRSAFGLTTDSAVIRRALALARVIVRAAQGADSIVVTKPDGRQLEIVLRG